MHESISVLHVEDDEDFAAVAAEYLHHNEPGLAVESVTTVRAGLDRLDSDEVDCVVSDYDLPGRSGLEFLEAVRARDAQLPFVLFTGKGSEEVAADAISAGVTDYLQKGGPGTFELLANRITNAVARCEERRRFETLVDTLPGVVYRTQNDPDWTNEFIRGEVEALTGYPAEAIQSSDPSWAQLIHPDDRQRVWDEVQSGLFAADAFELSYRIVHASDEVRWVWERGRSVGRTTDGVDILEGFITDITEQKAREQALETERNRFAAIFETVPEPAVHVVFKDGEPVIQRVNEAFAETFGHDTEAAAGRSIDELIVPETDRDIATDINRDVRETNHHQAEVVRETTTGMRPFLFTAKTMRVGDHEDAHLEGVATYVDLTEQIQREATLTRQNERLDQFASMVSHDLRNPLNVAVGRIELAIEETENEHLEPASESLADMEAQIEQLLEYTRDDLQPSEP